MLRIMLCVVFIVVISIAFAVDIITANDDVLDIDANDVDADNVTDNVNTEDAIVNSLKETTKNIDKLSDTIESIQKKHNRILMKNKLEALKNKDFHKLTENDYKYVETVKVNLYKKHVEQDEDLNLQHIGSRKITIATRQDIDVDKVICRTLYSANKYKHSRIYKTNKIQRIKPSWRTWNEEIEE